MKMSPCVIVGMVVFINGCVSIKTHEQAKIESFEAGEKDMAQRVRQAIYCGETEREILWTLMGILDLNDLKQVKEEK